MLNSTGPFRIFFSVSTPPPRNVKRISTGSGIQNSWNEKVWSGRESDFRYLWNVRSIKLFIQRTPTSGILHEHTFVFSLGGEVYAEHIRRQKVCPTGVPVMENEVLLLLNPLWVRETNGGVLYLAIFPSMFPDISSRYECPGVEYGWFLCGVHKNVCGRDRKRVRARRQRSHLLIPPPWRGMFLPESCLCLISRFLSLWFSYASTSIVRDSGQM